MATHNLPADWNDTTQLDGLDVTDKAELVDIPFRITGVLFRYNARQVQIVEVDGERADRTTFTFTDSSSGVRAQIAEYLKKIGKENVTESGELFALSLVIPRGLRVSKFMVTDDRGKDKEARTYYLTTSGTRESAQAPVKARTARAS